MAGSNTVIVTPDMPEGGIAKACQRALQHLILLYDNACLAAGGITHGTTAADVKTANTVTYRLDGVQKSLAAQDDFWALTGPVMTAGQVSRWLLCVDSAQAAAVVQSAVATAASGCVFADVTSGGNAYPSPGPSLSVFGMVQVTVNSSTFTPGTTSLAAGTITVAYVDGYTAATLGAAIPFDRQ